MIFAEKTKICKDCKESKPVNVRNWVPNRPHKVGRPDLPRGVHDTCKECESKKKTAAQLARWAKRDEYVRQQSEEELKRLRGEFEK